MRTACRHGLMLMLVLTAAAVHSQVASSYSFDNGQIPFGTMFPTVSDSSGNAHNPGAGVTNAGGFNNSGMLVMTVPASGQTFSQWQLPDFAVGQPITNLNLSFNVFMGGPVSGGNGMLFHWGLGLLYQYTGGAGSFGQGLDLTFRTYNSPPNTSGINIYNGGTSGPN